MRQKDFRDQDFNSRGGQRERSHRDTRGERTEWGSQDYNRGERSGSDRSSYRSQDYNRTADERHNRGLESDSRYDDYRADWGTRSDDGAMRSGTDYGHRRETSTAERWGEKLGEKVGQFFGIGPKGYKRSDERIKEDVCEGLWAHSEIDASDVEVDVSAGVVTLMGTIESRRIKRLIEDEIERVAGVHDVINNLRVRSAGSSPTSDAVKGESTTPRRLQ